MLYEKKGARWQMSQPVAGGALDTSVCILIDPQEQGTSQYPQRISCADHVHHLSSGSSSQVTITSFPVKHKQILQIFYSLGY